VWCTLTYRRLVPSCGAWLLARVDLTLTQRHLRGPLFYSPELNRGVNGGDPEADGVQFDWLVRKLLAASESADEDPAKVACALLAATPDPVDVARMVHPANQPALTAAVDAVCMALAASRARHAERLSKRAGRMGVCDPPTEVALTDGVECTSGGGYATAVARAQPYAYSCTVQANPDEVTVFSIDVTLTLRPTCYFDVFARLPPLSEPAPTSPPTAGTLHMVADRGRNHTARRVTSYRGPQSLVGVQTFPKHRVLIRGRTCPSHTESLGVLSYRVVGCPLILSRSVCWWCVGGVWGEGGGRVKNRCIVVCPHALGVYWTGIPDFKHPQSA
jgi:hypothetical protein